MDKISNKKTKKMGEKLAKKWTKKERKTVLELINFHSFVLRVSSEVTAMSSASSQFVPKADHLPW